MRTTEERKRWAEKARRWRASSPEVLERCRASCRRSYWKNVERRRADQVRRYHKNPSAWLSRAKEGRDKIRREVFSAYGNQCACCGDKTHEFLNIDHIHGPVTARRDEREGHRGGHPLYRWLLRNGCPKDEYQLLCANCNFAKSRWGSCPHRPLVEIL